MPIGWWVLSGLFAVSMLLAVGFYLGPVWGVAVGLVSMGAAAAILVGGASEITVDDTWFRAGRASIELGYLGRALPLDAPEARLRRGPAADARAFLLLRPYISTAVEVTLTDADDPTPYWLVASRRPRALAAALTKAIAAASPVRTATGS